jgi:hypothetical protein
MITAVRSGKTTIEYKKNVLLVSVIRESNHTVFAIAHGEIRGSAGLPLVYHRYPPPGIDVQSILQIVL